VLVFSDGTLFYTAVFINTSLLNDEALYWPPQCTR
jgi:hypothetical protein